jgi:hypothetical protein
MRRLALHWFLAVALVVAQLGIQAHALSHLDQALHGHDGAIHQTDHKAEACLAFDAAAGGAATSSPLASVVADAECAAPGLGSADPLLPSFALDRFASRAPPLRS